MKVEAGETAVDHYYLHDQLYSPVAVLGSAATVLERYEYDAYGACHVFDGGFAPRTSSPVGWVTLLPTQSIYYDIHTKVSKACSKDTKARKKKGRIKIIR